MERQHCGIRFATLCINKKYIQVLMKTMYKTTESKHSGTGNLSVPSCHCCQNSALADKEKLPTSTYSTRYWTHYPYMWINTLTVLKLLITLEWCILCTVSACEVNKLSLIIEGMGVVDHLLQGFQIQFR